MEVPAEAIIEWDKYESWSSNERVAAFYNMLKKRLGRREIPFDALICNNDSGAVAAVGWARRVEL